MISTVIPCMRCRDAPRMIDWLCENSEFQKQMVIPSEDSAIAHSLLALGTEMIMVGSVSKTETEWAKHIKRPDDIGGLAHRTEKCEAVFG